MKKLLIAIPFLLLAAACNKQPAPVQPVQNQPASTSQAQPQTQQPQATSTDNNIATWKTYTDLGVTFQYPPDWQAQTNPYMSVKGELQIVIVNSKTGGMQPDELILSTFDDRSGTANDYTLSPNRLFTDQNYNNIKFVINGKTIYAGCSDYLKGQSTLDACNQILSTFKFTK